jgi:ribonuclease HII
MSASVQAIRHTLPIVMTSLGYGPAAREVADGEVGSGGVADSTAAVAAGMAADIAGDCGAGGPGEYAAAVWDGSCGTFADDAPADPLPRPVLRPLGYTPRRGAGLSGYERVLARAGLVPVAGVDEAGRGACAGPLVVAAVVFATADPPVARLADSKALTPAVREEVYREVVAHALSWHTVVIPPAEIDRLGLHVCNIAGMRRALAGIACRLGYVLTDGFPVSGLTVPALAMWKGDQVAACVAAASVVAKVTRDRIMTSLHDDYPVYDFAEHKGYSTRRHARALAEYGPSPEHRLSFVNVMSAVQRRGLRARHMPDNGEMADAAQATLAGAGSAAAAADGHAATGAGYTARADWAEEPSGAS